MSSKITFNMLGLTVEIKVLISHDNYNDSLLNVPENCQKKDIEGKRRQ